MKNHKLSNIFPMMDETDFENLKRDIKENGFDKTRPIILFEDKILDGRNRFKACKEVDTEPNFITYEGKSPLGYVISNNLDRRHLTPSQRAVVAVEVLPLLEEENERLRKLKISEFRKTGETTQKIGESKHEKESAQQVAKQFHTNREYISVAKKLKETSPESFEDIKQGKKDFSDIKKEQRLVKIKEQEKEIEKLKPELEIKGVYNLIVIDPPWNYGREYDAETSRVASPYPEMPCFFPDKGECKYCYKETDFEVGEYISCSECGANLYKLGDYLEGIDLPADENSILFLWTTHQFIWDAKALLKKWGFEYKAILVWDKEKMGMGSWLRMQCEFCLIGIKGKPLWVTKDMRDIIRESRTAHSTKPEIFYNLIDKNFKDFRKLDYFARNKRDGWDVYGVNQK